MKTYKNRTIITTLLTLFPILIGLILWNRLPDSLPTHWGIDGQPNGWSSKSFAVFGLPCILALIHLFTIGVTLNDPKKKNIHHKLLALVFWMIPVLSILVNGIVYLAAMKITLNITSVVFFFVGIMFIVLGNYLPKLRQNYTVGIKLPWTLHSEENWNRTHRLGGKLMILSGFLTALFGCLSSTLGDTSFFMIIMFILFIPVIIPTAYSFYLFRKGI